MNTQDVGLRVLVCRRRAGLTQAELAARAGLAQVTVGRIERGLVISDLNTLTKLAAALDVDLAYILNGPAPEGAVA